MEKKKKDYPYIANVNYKSMVYRERDTGSQSLLFLWAVALWIDETRLGSCICSVAFSELEFYMENRRKKKVLSTLAWKSSCPKSCTMEDVILIILTILATQSTSNFFHNAWHFHSENDWTLYCSDVLTFCDWYWWPSFCFLSINIYLHKSALNKRLSCCWFSSPWHVFYFHVSHQI